MNVERLRKDNRRPFITVSDFKLLTEKPFPKGGPPQRNAWVLQESRFPSSHGYTANLLGAKTVPLLYLFWIHMEQFRLYKKQAEHIPMLSDHWAEMVPRKGHDYIPYKTSFWEQQASTGQGCNCSSSRRRARAGLEGPVEIQHLRQGATALAAKTFLISQR